MLSPLFFIRAISSFLYKSKKKNDLAIYLKDIYYINVNDDSTIISLYFVRNGIPEQFTFTEVQYENNTFQDLVQQLKKFKSKFTDKSLEKPPQAGGRKSKSNPKTRTQKRRSTNPKNKRTRKSKK